MIHGCSTLDVLTSIYDTIKLHISPMSEPASHHDLLKADALMWSHPIRISLSIYLFHKKLHLVPKMLLPNALWQLVTILQTSIALHTLPARSSGRE